jgi:chromosomal replication initiator protein DnaA
MRNSFRCLYGLCQGSSGGNLIELFALSRKMSISDAATELVRELGLSVSASIDNEFIQHNAEVAQNFLELGAYDEAEKEFLELVRLRPDFKEGHEGLLKIYTARQNTERQADLHEALARLCLGTNHFDEALRHAHELSQFRPDAIETHQLLGECFVEAFDREGAINEFMALADLSESAGDFQRAIDAYMRVEQLGSDLIDVNPHIVRAFTHAGNPRQALEHMVTKAERAAQTGDYSRAAELYTLVLDVEPDRTDLKARFVEIAGLAVPTVELTARLFATLDELLNTDDQRERATNLLEKLLENPATSAAALEKLSENYRVQGREEQALQLQVRAARANFEAGDTSGALQQLNALLELHPENLEALRAVSEIENARKNVLGMNDALRRLARIYLHAGQFELAIEACDRILSTEETALDAAECRAESLEGLGARLPEKLDEASRAFEQIGRHYSEGSAGHRAISYLEKSANLGNSRPEPYTQLALAYQRAGDNDKARTAMIRASELLYAGGRFDEAIENCNQLLQVLPADIVLGQHTADLYARRGDKAEAANRLIAIAHQLMREQQNSRAAEPLLERALTYNPEDFELIEELAEIYSARHEIASFIKLQYKLAGIFEQRQNWKTVAQALRRIIEKIPAEIPAINRLIQCYERLGNPDAAQDTRLKLAAVHRERGDSEREVRVLREALNFEPENESLLGLLVACEFSRYDMPAACTAASVLAKVQRKLGKNAAASATLRQAAAQAPDNLDVHRELFRLLCDSESRHEAVTIGLHLVDILTNSRKHEEAAEVYEQIIQCDPENLTLRLNQVDSMRKAGMNEQAAGKLFELGNIYRAKESYEEASRAILEVVRLQPENLAAREELASIYASTGQEEKLDEALHQLATAYYHAGEYEKAVASIQRLLQRSPENTMARRQLADFFKNMGNTGDAIRELLSLAQSLREAGADDEALKVDREAAFLAPDNSQVRKRLVEDLMHSGENSKAGEELIQLAALQIERQKFTEALQTLNSCLNLFPDNIHARQSRADLYARMGDEPRALEEFRAISAELSASRQPGETPAQSVKPAESNMLPIETGLHIVREYDFESFVVGPNNNFAHATALAVARAPARAYNPLFIYSDVGMGKTHLANAIANYLLMQNAKARILYTNTEDFTVELVSAISNNAVHAFRTRYKSVDLLIVDDVQFLAEKERAQEEFFHIFNALFQAKRQIVVTSDRPPRDIARLENRLLSRFGAGVIVDIQPPDLETRIAILSREIETGQLGLESWVAIQIAERIDTNVRELKGVLNQVMAMRDMRGVAVSEESIRGVIETLYVRA